MIAAITVNEGFTFHTALPRLQHSITYRSAKTTSALTRSMSENGTGLGALRNLRKQLRYSINPNRKRHITGTPCALSCTVQHAETQFSHLSDSCLPLGRTVSGRAVSDRSPSRAPVSAGHSRGIDCMLITTRRPRGGRLLTCVAASTQNTTTALPPQRYRHRCCCRAMAGRVTAGFMRADPTAGHGRTAIRSPDATAMGARRSPLVSGPGSRARGDSRPLGSNVSRQRPSDQFSESTGER